MQSRTDEDQKVAPKVGENPPASKVKDALKRRARTFRQKGEEVSK